jgi:hypothetical protein
LQTNPEVAKTIKANDLGKFAHRELKPDRKGKGKGTRKESNPEHEPWKERLQVKAKMRVSNNEKRILAELSD